MPIVNVDLTKEQPAPQGELLLQVSKAEFATSKAGNMMINYQLTVVAGEDDQFNGRMIFGSWNLTPETATWKLKAALKAFIGGVPEPGELDTDILCQQLVESAPVWCAVVPVPGKGEYADQVKAEVKKYGIDPSAS